MDLTGGNSSDGTLIEIWKSEAEPQGGQAFPNQDFITPGRD